MKVIAERLGNTVEMIYTIYGHVLKELKVRAVDLFAESLATGGILGLVLHEPSSNLCAATFFGKCPKYMLY